MIHICGDELSCLIPLIEMVPTALAGLKGRLCGKCQENGGDQDAGADAACCGTSEIASAGGRGVSEDRASPR